MFQTFFAYWFKCIKSIFRVISVLNDTICWVMFENVKNKNDIDYSSCMWWAYTLISWRLELLFLIQIQSIETKRIVDARLKSISFFINQFSLKSYNWLFDIDVQIWHHWTNENIVILKSLLIFFCHDFVVINKQLITICQNFKFAELMHVFDTNSFENKISHKFNYARWTCFTKTK